MVCFQSFELSFEAFGESFAALVWFRKSASSITASAVTGGASLAAAAVAP